MTILAAELLVPALPYLLGFAAGAMLYVVVEEMIPEMSQGRHSHIGVLAFAAGFSVMMVLDVAWDDGQDNFCPVSFSSCPLRRSLCVPK